MCCIGHISYAEALLCLLMLSSDRGFLRTATAAETEMSINRSVRTVEHNAVSKSLFGFSFTWDILHHLTPAGAKCVAAVTCQKLQGQVFSEGEHPGQLQPGTDQMLKSNIHFLAPRDNNKQIFLILFDYFLKINTVTSGTQKHALMS